MKSLLHISSFVRVADVDGEEDAADEDHRDDVGDDSEENLVEVLGVNEGRSLLFDGREVGAEGELGLVNGPLLVISWRGVVTLVARVILQEAVIETLHRGL